MAEDIKDNGDKPNDIVMIIVLDRNGICKVDFQFLADKIATYGFLKLAEKTLDDFYKRAEKPKILAVSQMPNLKVN